MSKVEEHAGTSRTIAVEHLPAYETKSETVRQGRAAIIVALVCALASFAVSIGILSTSGLVHSVEFDEAGAEVVSFAVNIVVTACSDALGYVHSTSLRWALYREGRLEYNTNFRLFRSARSSAPNRWPMNLLSAASLVLCYACTSVLLVRDFRTDGWFGVNATALLGLGLGLVGQSITAIACMRRVGRDVPTWSSNSLNNTLASLRGQSGLHHRPGRCMLSVFERDALPTAVRPRAIQRPLWGLRSTRWIVAFIWALSGLTYVWFGICLAIPTSMFTTNEFEFSWSDDSTTHAVHFGMDQATNTPNDPVYFPEPAHFVLSILFLCFVQGFQTLALHCVELLVNMRRDEKTWRAASTERGATISAAPLWAALATWETDVLFIIKAGAHWLIGQSMVPYFQLEVLPGYFEFHMSYSRLLVLALFTTLIAIFTTWLAASKVSGPQPAAWGHLQTLANLVDDWEMPQKRLWWGDKGARPSEIRHAGTVGSRDKVASIRMDAKYARD